MVSRKEQRRYCKECRQGWPWILLVAPLHIRIREAISERREVARWCKEHPELEHLRGY